MLLDDAVHVVLDVCSHYEAILRAALHGLCVDVIVVAVVLHKPSLVLELLEVLGCTLIYAWVILARAEGEVYLGFNDVVERHLVVAGLGARLVAVEHIVGAALHALHQLLGRAQATEGFYLSHDSTYLFTWNFVMPRSMKSTIW